MSTFSQSLDPDSIASTRENIRLMKEYAIVWFTVLVWDTLATLPSEWRYIHKAKWTPLKVMFLINRWYTIAAQASTAFLLLAPLSPNTCRKIFWGFATDGIAVMFFCDCIIAIRVYAVYEKSRKMLYVLVAMLAADLGLMVGAATQLRPVIYSPELREALQFEGCAAAIPNGKYTWLISIIYWSPPLIFNFVALALIFHRNFELSRQAGRIPILQRMLKDGLFFFSVIVAANLVNVILVASQTSPALKNFNIPASLTLTSLMCSRLVLSLHQHNADVRRSLGGGAGTLERITSNPGPSVVRQSQISCRSHTRKPSRSRLDDCTEEEREEAEGEGDDDTDATTREAESSESFNDKFKCTVQLESTDPLEHVPSLARVKDSTLLSPPSTPRTSEMQETRSRSPTTVSTSRRRDSSVSFVFPEEVV
ncbi:hypothetical protein JCM3765_002846 [Sporobolomyces pararoseus]